ncbi:MAG: SAM-dependent methyltransferase [Pseudomonadota bacterium]
MTHQLPRLSIALISATALAYELLLMRLFSIVQWHHFAYMIISLALLGYGASGTFLSLRAPRLLQNYPRAYLTNIAAFAVAILGCYLLAQRISFNAEELLWQPSQWLSLAAIYLLLSLPFFFAANALGLSLIYFKERAARIYSADLLGAGLGCLLIIGLLFLVFAQQAIVALVIILGCALLCAAWELKVKGQLWRWLAAASVLVVFLPGAWLAPQLSEYKGLSQMKRVAGVEVVEERSSPLGLLSVVDSPQIPLRYAPGLSVAASSWPGEQRGVFFDGDNMTAITAMPASRAQLAYLDELTSALPYHLHEPQQVLVLGAGGGAEVMQAYYHQASFIDAVELNSQLVDLLKREYSAYTGDLFNRDEVNLISAEARGFVATTAQRYDLIQLSLLDAFAASSAGMYALSETYLYTVEAMGLYLSRLNTNGLVAITRWVDLPPRDGLKMFNTLVHALRALDGQPSQQLMMIRGWQTTTILAKNGVFTQEQIAQLKHFCRERGFDLVYYPGMALEEANQFNLLPQPYFAQAAQALLSDQAEQFLADYKFDLTAPTDDRPYFHRFLKWTSLSELLSLRERGGMGLLEWGYLILLATLLQALVASVIFILLPLGLRALAAGERLRRPLPAFSYFFLLGLAFLFLEIAFMQRFTQFLFHPLYTIAVVLCAFLIFAGLGSAYAQRFAAAGRLRQGIAFAVGGIALCGLSYLVLLGPLFTALIGLHPALKVLLTIVLIAPLAFCMGMPFPLGLAHLGRTQPALLPWVWGVNGCASVLSAVLAMLLAVHFGFAVVVLAGLLLYLLAYATMRREVAADVR